MKQQEIENMLLDYAAGTLSESECEMVEKWIAASEENRRKAVRAASLEQSMAAQYAGNAVDVDAAFRRNQCKLSKSRRRAVLSHFSRAAAILSIPLLIATLWLGIAYFSPEDQSMVVIRTTTGMTSNVTLPDGSQVWLNSNSTLSYPSKFTAVTRSVSLEGQGFFKVAKQNGRKFVVNAGDVAVEVLGTEFDVEAYSDKGDEVRTTLLSGKVVLNYKDISGQKATQEMFPGECFAFHKSNRKLERMDVNPQSAAAWKDGRIILDDTSFADALRMVENRYNVEFVIQNPELLDNRYTGSFTNQSLDAVLWHFERTTKVTFDSNALAVESSYLTGRQKIIVK